ncbi:olfactory receptor 13F1-like [Anabas testudineus]|uniref:G-protein coupled receptors family 1 profile domain-containing protein n=1 Tax=Anabas testudineus TaxID=64144 RepID=A0A7N6AJ62_ANATE|nr:olfactory receptor 13F1-like [Anabas testudineus]
MENDTVFHFNLTMYVNIGFYRYPAFVVCLLLFAIILLANLAIILVVSLERTLHEPMYLFIALLSVNSLYGSTGFFPRFLMDLLSDTHLISRPACFTQIYIIYTYAFQEMTILSIMAYDRYVAVCDPLHHHNKVTAKTVCRLAAFAWMCPAFSTGLGLYLAIKLPLCGNKLQKIYCAIWNIAKLSCVSTSTNNVVGILASVINVILPLIYVLYTYFRIILVCRKSSTEFKSKVFQTCLPHTILFVSLSFSIFCDIALSRLNVENLNPLFALILSLEFVLIPPLLNPLIYGLKLPEIQRNIFKMLSFLNFQI